MQKKLFLRAFAIHPTPTAQQKSAKQPSVFRMVLFSDGQDQDREKKGGERRDKKKNGSFKCVRVHLCKFMRGCRKHNSVSGAESTVGREDLGEERQHRCTAPHDRLLFTIFLFCKILNSSPAHSRRFKMILSPRRFVVGKNKIAKTPHFG